MTVTATTPAARYFASRWERLAGAQRIAGIDLARGIAVLGMFGAHLLMTSPELIWSNPATWDAMVHGRSSILFATLAGVSIGLLTGGSTPYAAERMRIARGRLAVRAGVLFVLGIVLVLTGVPVYVILPAYAILFLLAVPFTRMPAGGVLVVAVVLALVMPFVQVPLDAAPLWSAPFGAELSALLGWAYPFPVWIAFILAGLALARFGLARWRVQVAMVVAGALLAVVGYALERARVPSEWRDVWTAEPHSSGVLEVIGSGGFAIAVIGLCLLLCRTPIQWLAVPLRAVGSMPLTAYTAQLVVWAWIAFALFGTTGDLYAFQALQPFWPLTLGTLIGCTVWALCVGRGPLEWVMDRAASFVARDGSGSAPR